MILNYGTYPSIMIDCYYSLRTYCIMGDYQGDYLVRFMAKTDNSAMSALNKYKNDIAQKEDYLKAQK